MMKVNPVKKQKKTKEGAKRSEQKAVEVVVLDDKYRIDFMRAGHIYIQPFTFALSKIICISSAVMIGAY